MKNLLLLFTLVALVPIFGAEAKTFKAISEITEEDFVESPREDSEEVSYHKKRRKIFRARGAVLVVTGPVVITGGLISMIFGSFYALCDVSPGTAAALLVGGAVAFVGGTYMIIQSAYDFISAKAHNKRIRRLRMKEEAELHGNSYYGQNTPEQYVA